MKKILYAMILVVCFTGYAGAEQEIFKPQDLPNAFAANPDTAKDQYMDKTVQIKGIVVDKGMSRYMTPNIEISESGKDPAAAICVFPYSGIAYWNRQAQIEPFEPGQTVVISGRVHSLSGNRVLLKESRLVE